jgi:geranylgeranyl reductase family protein
MRYDAIIVGGGPAGSTCAALLAQAGQRVLVLEKCIFPREKVCGDCINPSCWPVLERLGLDKRVLNLSHARLQRVEFISIRGSSVVLPLPDHHRGEIAVKRSLFDQLLLDRAAECGAEIRQGVSVSALAQGWRLQAGDEICESRTLVAADGRNSTVARLLNLLPAPRRDRVAIQTHLPERAGADARVTLRFLPEGYCGVAGVGGGELNICLVSRPGKLPSLRSWAESQFQIPRDHAWRTITPLSRQPIAAAHENLFLIGDAARVVEPFTGEGIYYALASGELAANHIVESLPAAGYRRAQASLYRGRLWINKLSRHAVLHPHAGSWMLELLRLEPRALRLLTSKIVATGA